ncbi:hypothetical protein EVAR_27719_1 [Eumeta japonica]|uniref:Uncharacterized protein n=1 Tax=Eumeta variegata TaxID=151549 RepID=A0A4C1WMT5_EUMVA|nr:hypothetical protein EVAR_27719_1 [Eumeta japonica]
MRKRIPKLIEASSRQLVPARAAQEGVFISGQGATQGGALHVCTYVHIKYVSIPNDNNLTYGEQSFSVLKGLRRRVRFSIYLLNDFLVVTYSTRAGGAGGARAQERRDARAGRMSGRPARASFVIFHPDMHIQRGR